MADFAWLVRRLKAMSAPEVAWRISQKAIQKSEENRFKSRKTAVTEILFNEKLSALQLDADRMHLNWDNKTFSLGTEIPLLGGITMRPIKRGGMLDSRQKITGRNSLAMGWSISNVMTLAMPEQTGN